jgi:soluble lytic murein transglycosylase
MVVKVLVRFAVATALATATVSGFVAFPVTPAIAAPNVSSLSVQAADAAYKGRYAEAGSLAKRSGDPAAQKLVELIYLKNSWKDAGYSRIMDFLAQAKGWPLSETLAKNAERALWAQGARANTVLQHFAERKPLTPEGSLALARAYLETGNQKQAKAALMAAWLNPEVDAATEKKAASEFAGLLSQDDVKKRMWRLVYAQETNAAIRVSRRLSPDHQAAAKVAQLLIRGTSDAERQYAKLSSAMRSSYAVQYALARYYRKLDRDSKARALLAKIPADHEVIGDGEAWWIERRILARRSLERGQNDHWRTAYALAKSHGFAKGEFYNEGEFLAGWIALRFLKDPQTALKHFGRLDRAAETRTDLARAAYWTARAHAANGNAEAAKSSYREASQYHTIYYGQLSREQLGLAKKAIAITGGQPSAAALARVENDEVIRALQITAKAGRKAELNMFLWSITSRFKTADEMNAAASIAAQLGGPTLALRLAKLSGQKGLDIDTWGYPTKALPKWAQLGRPVERALVYGLSRQESEFDAKAGSKAGAQGLMQLMPGTAKLVAKQYRVPYAPAKLTGDPAYNVKLGAAHLGDLIAEYEGSYILTLVAYNAGPRRAREWVQAFGDPRSKNVDAIDWVESIPIQETRQYVQKVLQNVHIYRSRLAPETMQAMSADLKRGGSSALTTASTKPAETQTCAAKVVNMESLISSCE